MGVTLSNTRLANRLCCSIPCPVGSVSRVRGGRNRSARFPGASRIRARRRPVECERLSGR